MVSYNSKPQRKGYKNNFYIKQQFRFFYGLLRDQALRNFFKRYSIKINNLSSSFFGDLERRLDVFLFRTRILPTVFACNQFVFHQGVFINYSLHKQPNFLIKVGDTIKIQPKHWYSLSSFMIERLYFRLHGLSLFKKRVKKKIKKYYRRLRLWKKLHNVIKIWKRRKLKYVLFLKKMLQEIENRLYFFNKVIGTPNTFYNKEILSIIKQYRDNLITLSEEAYPFYALFLKKNILNKKTKLINLLKKEKPKSFYNKWKCSLMWREKGSFLHKFLWTWKMQRELSTMRKQYFLKNKKRCKSLSFLNRRVKKKLFDNSATYLFKDNENLRFYRNSNFIKKRNFLSNNSYKNLDIFFKKADISLFYKLFKNRKCFKQLILLNFFDFYKSPNFYKFSEFFKYVSCLKIFNNIKSARLFNSFFKFCVLGLKKDKNVMLSELYGRVVKYRKLRKIKISFKQVKNLIFVIKIWCFLCQYKKELFLFYSKNLKGIPENLNRSHNISKSIYCLKKKNFISKKKIKSFRKSSRVIFKFVFEFFFKKVRLNIGRKSLKRITENLYYFPLSSYNFLKNKKEKNKKIWDMFLKNRKKLGKFLRKRVKKYYMNRRWRLIYLRNRKRKWQKKRYRRKLFRPFFMQKKLKKKLKRKGNLKKKLLSITKNNFLNLNWKWFLNKKWKNVYFNQNIEHKNIDFTSSLKKSIWILKKKNYYPQEYFVSKWKNWILSFFCLKKKVKSTKVKFLVKMLKKEKQIRNFSYKYVENKKIKLLSHKKKLVSLYNWYLRILNKDFSFIKKILHIYFLTQLSFWQMWLKLLEYWKINTKEKGKDNDINFLNNMKLFMKENGLFLKNDISLADADREIKEIFNFIKSKQEYLVWNFITISRKTEYIYKTRLLLRLSLLRIKKWKKNFMNTFFKKKKIKKNTKTKIFSTKTCTLISS